MAPTNEDKHRETYEAAQNAVRALDPTATAERCGARWLPAGGGGGSSDAGSGSSGGRDDGSEGGSGTMELEALGHMARIAWPALTFEADHPLLQTFPWRLIALHYLATATSRPIGENWVSYRELPDGLFYADTITREVEEPLARLFATDTERFLTAGAQAGGVPGRLADVSLTFLPLPKVPVVFALWAEDEEFPATLKVLYEREGAANVPLQDLRILADLLGAALRRGGGPPAGR
ncbi:MAG: DUF3786 domain-containing protein [Actinobacteria bacterium]|nr:DUF3786 domain-containing protein [Actinomycetota bacterium]